MGVPTGGRVEAAPPLARIARRAVPIAILVAAGVLVPLTALGSRLPLLIAGLAVGVVGIYGLWWWPEIGFPLLVPTSMLVPVTISTGAQTGVNAALLLAMAMLGMWVVDMVARKREVTLAPSSTVVPLLGWMIACLLSFGFGRLNWLPGEGSPLTGQLGGLALLILLPGMFMLSFNQLRNLRTLRWTTWLFLSLGGIFIAGILIPGNAPRTFGTYQRAVTDAMFWTWLVTICFSQAAFNRQLKPGLRLLLGAIACGAFYYMIEVRQSWTSGWLPAAVSIWIVLLVARPRWAIAALLVTGGLALLAPGAVNELLLGGDNAYSMQTRLEAWRIIWKIVRLSPIFGVGPANYFAYTPLYPILGFSVNFNSHNNYLDIVAQVGFVGLGFFIWFMIALVKVLLRAVRQAPQGFPQAFALGAVGALAGMLVSGLLGDWMIPFLYNIGLEGFRAAVLGWTFLGAAAAMGEPNGLAATSGGIG